jgi:hypothetical protein
MDISSNLLTSLGFSIGLGIAGLVIYVRHPHGPKTYGPVEASSLGFGINATAWLLMFLAASYVGVDYPLIWRTFSLALDTRLLFVPLVDWSLVGVPLAFFIHQNSRGHTDYRAKAVIAVLILVSLLCFYYYLKGGPANPLAFP